MALTSCNSTNNIQSIEESSNESMSEQENENNKGTREMKTYIDFNFDGLEVGQDVPIEDFDFTEGGGFVASSKDKDGNVWVSPKDVLSNSMWGLNEKAIRDEKGNQIPLTDFSIEFTTRLPYSKANHVSDGGITFMYSSMIGRYDLAFNYDSSNEGRYSSVNLWMAQAPSGTSAFATTSSTDSGSKIRNFELYAGQDYKVTVCCKYTGKNEKGEDICTILVFIDNTLIIQQTNILFWVGGFGLRGYQSDWEYGSFKVSDYPLVCPDGIDHYSNENIENAKTLQKLQTPTLKTDGKTASWSAVENASYYDIFDGSTNFVGRVTTTEFPLSDYFSSTGNFKLLAGNNTFGFNRSDYAQGSYELADALPAPTLDKKDTTVLFWNAIDYAVGYELFLDGESFKTFDKNTLEFDANGYDGDFRIRALGDGVNYLNSPLSNAVSPAKPHLSAPVIKYKDGTIKWDAISNASSYSVYYNGTLLTTVDDCFYSTTTYGKYYVVAIPSDDARFKESFISNILTVRKTGSVYYTENFAGTPAGQTVDISQCGWGIYYNDGRLWEAKEEYKDGAMWVGVTEPYERSYSPNVGLQWSGTYFPATNQGAYLTNWTYTTDFLLKSNGPDGYDFFQLIFATQKTGGRYALDFKVYKETKDGAFTTKAIIGLYDNSNCYLYYDNAPLTYDVVHKFTINYSLQENGKARISYYIDEILVFDEFDLPHGTGDFGFSIISGNPMFTNIQVNDIPYESPDGEDRY